MKERMQDIWDRIGEKEALATAGLALCREDKGMLLLKLWISVACALIMALTPVTSAAKELSTLLSRMP